MATEDAQVLDWRGLGIFLCISAVGMILTWVLARQLELRPYGALLALGLITVVNGVRTLRRQVRPIGRKRSSGRIEG